MNQNDSSDASNTADAAQHSGRSNANSLVVECERLREALLLSRRELAQVRLRQEADLERIAELSAVEAERDRLASQFALHLGRPVVDPLTVGGVRGWIARRLFGPLLTPVGVGDPQVAMIDASDLFDAGWYLRTYPDVAEAGEWPAAHYFYHGALEGRAASPRFDTAFYVARYPDVRESGINPLVHYIQSGQSEGRLAVQPAYERLISAPRSED